MELNTRIQNLFKDQKTASMSVREIVRALNHWKYFNTAIGTAVTRDMVRNASKFDLTELAGEEVMITKVAL